MPSNCSKLFIALVVICCSVNAVAAKMGKKELEAQYLYGWSQSATLAIYGTVAAVDYKDDPKQKSAHVEVMLRVDSIQRGVPGNSMVRVRIEDELQTYRWNTDKRRIGENGVWFLHRVRQFGGREPRGYLIRYIPREELERDPQYFSELMKYVIQDTVDKMIKPNALNLLSTEKTSRETASIKMALTYDEYGALDDIDILERSKNPLFNSHVFDIVLQVHRRIRIPGKVRKTVIEINRDML